MGDREVFDTSLEDEMIEIQEDVLDREDAPEAIVSMYTASGEQIDFAVIAYIPLEDKTYYIMQPVMLLQGMGQDEALVFECEQFSEDEAHYTIVTDGDIIDAVFAEYERLCQELDD